jgi:hypothetical protein
MYHILLPGEKPAKCLPKDGGFSSFASSAPSWKLGQIHFLISNQQFSEPTHLLMSMGVLAQF